MDMLLPQLAEPAFWGVALQVAGVNLMLSGDNVVAITLAARELAPKRRRLGVTLGVAVAVILTAVFIAIASILMQTPFLKLVAGAALLHIAFHLGLPDPADDGRVVDEAMGVLRAAGEIALATLVMSFDNVVAIAAVAEGDLLAMGLGLAVSLPLVVAGAAAIGELFERRPAFAVLGAGFLGGIAGETIAEDPVATAAVAAMLGPAAIPKVEHAAALIAAATVVALRWGRPRAIAPQEGETPHGRTETRRLDSRRRTTPEAP
jgi:YjbE family integral membrane protein